MPDYRPELEPPDALDWTPESAAPPTAPPTAPAPPPTPGPTAPGSRIVAMDAARGLALLGIFLVNMRLFGQPVGMAYAIVPPEGASGIDSAAFYFTKILCEGKFYPLFAALFGMGIALQFARSRARRGPFASVQLRRLALLAAIGAAHAVLLWFGDILFAYALAGAALVLFAFASARAMLISGAGLALFGVLVMTGMIALMSLAGEAGAPGGGQAGVPGAAGAAAPAAAQETLEQAPGAAEGGPVLRFFEALGEGRIQSPDDPLWMELETEAFRDGGFWQATGFRLISWSFFLFSYMFGLFWHVLGMFFIGAGLMKLGFFSPERAGLLKILLWVGLGAALPVCVVAAVLVPAALPEGAGLVVSLLVQLLLGPLVALAYLSGVVLLVHSGAAARLVEWLAAAGRMALSNYILQTLAATFVMYHWGLGLFGQTTSSQRMALAVGVFAGQVALSVLWLRLFRMGPLEWLWRLGTYLRPVGLLRN